MVILEKRISEEGIVAENDILKVGSFLNQQIDVPFMDALCQEFYNLYKNSNITKVLTIEASGISAATLTALHFGVPCVFAKKSHTTNLSGNLYKSEVYSFTHKCTNIAVVSQDYLSKNDRILIVDDFLANGAALSALIDIVNQAGATLVGCGILIEKLYQGGGNKLRQLGIRIESLAKIKNLYGKNGIEFEN